MEFMYTNIDNEQGLEAETFVKQTHHRDAQINIS